MKLKIVFLVLIGLIFITTSTVAIDIEAIQKTLKKEGYRPGPVDGFLGEKTIDALVAYQKAYGLPQKQGKIDSETKIALKVNHNLEPGEKTKRSTFRSQYEKAVALCSKRWRH